MLRCLLSCLFSFWVGAVRSQHLFQDTYLPTYISFELVFFFSLKLHQAIDKYMDLLVL